MIISLIISCVLLYFFVRPFIKDKKDLNNYLRLFLILAPIGLLFYLLTNYLIFGNRPESVKTGIELLKEKKEITNQIGSLISYSMNENELPTEEDNPAFFKISLEGTKAKLFLNCEMHKDSLNNWTLYKFVQDSIELKNE